MKNKLFNFFEGVFSPVTMLASIWIKFLLKNSYSSKSTAIFLKNGFLPIPDHYYYPLINPKKHLYHSLRIERRIPGICYNSEFQLKLLSEFDYNNELIALPIRKIENSINFYYENNFFSYGDAEILYNMIRFYKPKRFIEVGSGYSTLMAINAIKRNFRDDNNYNCQHTCIEPYEMDWLEKLDINLYREKLENVDLNIFFELQENDILFIDSSHIIRPQGDVLKLCLSIIQSLNNGVIIHFHDIFTPYDYPDKWILDDHLLWNEQYLLEAFLSFNNCFEILIAANYLLKNFFTELSEKCPMLILHPQSELGSFWIRKIC